MRFHESACAISSLFLAAGAAMPAWSQTADQSAAAASDTGLAEIIVTANKRAQTINDVDMSVAVISAGQLKTREINTLADIANSVPGLTFANTQTNTPVYTIRGVGFYDDSLGGYPAVSINVDDIPLPFPALAAHAAYDLERIEVLKGPRGTLYGENATGVAVNLNEAKPTKTFSAGSDLSYGRFNTVDMDASSADLSQTC
jgi:iron complex outermembrane recepter protein